MGNRRNKLYKIVITIIICLIVIVGLVILFVSPIVKYLVEKYDEKYTGRQIEMDWAYVNPFTGYIHFSDFRIYEFKSNTVFFTSAGVSAKIEMCKLLSKTYEISELTLNKPRGIIIQNEKTLNFDDLIEMFVSKKDSLIKIAPVHFNIFKVKIYDGEFYYRENQIPINYYIKNVNFESTGKRWDTDTIAAQFTFLPGIGGGEMKGNFTINVENKDYRFAAIANKYDLQIIGQYLKDLTNYGSFRANLDADIKAVGNFSDEEDITATGMLAINDFHFGKTTTDDYASLDRAVLAIKKLSPKNDIYFFDSISVDHPYLKYERYDYLDNVQTMFGKEGANIAAAQADPAKFNLVIEIADYIKVLSKNFFHSDYKIGRLAIYKGDLKFNDYSINEKFSADLNPLYIIADSIDKNHKRVNFSFESGIKPYGNLSGDLSINPQDSSDFDMQYRLANLSASMLNPYTITYTSFPLDRGTIELKGKWKVRNGEIQSDNHLIIIDPRVSKRVKNKNTTRIPMPLIMSFTKEKGNVIDYEIPITGNLKSPTFHFRDVIKDVLKNIFIKPVTTPYRLRVKSTEAEIEKSHLLKWPMLNYNLRANQEKFIRRIADFLTENPEATIKVYPQNYTIKEKEYILFFEAKKKYYLFKNKKNVEFFSKSDSTKVDKISVKDTMFVAYLNKNIKSNMFTVQDKCSMIVDSSVVNAKFERLNKERVNTFLSYFIEKKLEKRIKVFRSEKVIPYNGFSFYKIAYNGELPIYLLNAYERMHELDDSEPRVKFKKERKENEKL